MSDVVSQRPDSEDLSVHVRRGDASRVEQRALARLLQQDTTLRAAHQVGLDLDRDSSVRAGDEQLIARAADAALASVLAELPAAPVRGQRFAGWQLVASLFAMFAFSLSGVGAAMWVAGVAPWQKSEDEQESAAPVSQPARPARPHARRVRAPQVEVAPPVVEPGAPESVEPIEGAEKPSSSRSARAHDPKVLFHAANSARRAGDSARAKHLYGDLITYAPGSDEAHLAHVSLGKLLLAQGQAAAAERSFQRYLESGGGPLSEEALFSRAQCLLRLGRAHSEGSAWRALLAAFPDSVYAAEAQQRLTVLDKQAR
jgi:TolA-binding protein